MGTKEGLADKIVGRRLEVVGIVVGLILETSGICAGTIEGWSDSLTDE